jgi:arylformamidase
LGRIIDLSHTLRTGITVYPGTQLPVIDEVCSIALNGFSERFLKMCSHTGTHIDVPAHIFAGGKSITDLPVDSFSGTAFKFSNLQNLSVNMVNLAIDKFGLPDFIIFETGWDKFWDTSDYFDKYPLPANGIFEYIGRLGIKGVGIDAISIDPVLSDKLPNHHSILSRNMIIIENLTRLNQLPDSKFEFFCFPLKIENGDGSPVRAVARID